MPPILSVIMASYDAAATVSRALAALAAQTRGDAIEVVVVDSSRDDTPAIVTRELPSARLVRSSERLFAGDARNRGAAIAGGEILAFLDADCTVEPDWADRVLASHASPHSAIGGVVANGNPESATGWAYYFAEFHRWMPGATAGFVDEVPGCSATVKRAAYDRFGPFLAGAYCSDTDFFWRLADAGVRPWLDPAIRVAHLNPTRFAAAARHELRHGRDFARLRARVRLGRGGAAARAIAAPLLPALLFARATASAWRRRELRGRLLRAAPRLAGFVAAWSAGELAGYAEAAVAPRRAAAVG